MRPPNILVLLCTLILAFVGVWEHLKLPVRIPQRRVPLLGSTNETLHFLAAHSFWVVFSAWLLLAISVFLPKLARGRSDRSEPIDMMGEKRDSAEPVEQAT